MTDANGHAPSPRLTDIGLNARLAEWLDERRALLLGLAHLRALGDEASDAVDAVLDIPDVKQMRLGWELFEALAEGDGLDPEDLLLEILPWELLELARTAFWGTETWDPPRLRPV